MASNSFFIIFVVVVGVLGQFFLKTGLESFSDLEFSNFFKKLFIIAIEPKILAAGLCYLFGGICYFFLLSKANLTRIYPIITSSILAGITILGFLIFKEPIGYMKLFGVGLIIAGICCVSAGTP